MFNYEEFVKDRDEALLSLDKEKILSYFEKYGVKNTASNDLVFWAAIHKAILHITAATAEQKKNSFNWLINHGFRPEIRWGNKID